MVALDFDFCIMARILAIDYGKKRTGLAVTDVLQIIANGLATVPTHTLIDYILDFVKREPVERERVNQVMYTNASEEGNGNKKTVKNDTKVGRNDPCPCGSGKKYKSCCGK